MNQPPLVTVPQNASAPQPLYVFPGQDTVLVKVLASDPDGELLTFAWDIPRATDLPQVLEFQERNGDWVSVVTVPTEWLQHGDAVEVSISDQAQPRNVVTVQWTVQVMP